MLFYKVGPSPREWWGMVITSTDDGRTWSAPRRLPDGILGPIKNKPVQLADGTIVAGSSTEAVKDDAWRVHVELSRDGGRTWEKVAVGDGGVNAIQPTILRHADGRLQLLCRSKEMQVPTTWSSDGGRSWSPLASSGLFAVNSGSDAVTLQDGRHLLVYNYRDKPGASPANYRPDLLVGMAGAPSGERARWPLVVSSSRDGVAWAQAVTLDDAPLRHGYAYPAIIQTRDGHVHITYTFNREKSSTWCSIRRRSDRRRPAPHGSCLLGGSGREGIGGRSPLREPRQRAGGPVRPHLAVDLVEALARHDAHRDRVRQLLGLQIRVVGVDPHMAELVGDHGPQLVRAEQLEEPLLDRKAVGARHALHRLDRRLQRIGRDQLDADVLRDGEVAAHRVDERLHLMRRDDRDRSRLVRTGLARRAEHQPQQPNQRSVPREAACGPDVEEGIDGRVAIGTLGSRVGHMRG